MKILLLLLLPTLIFSQTIYQNGFKAGYEAGYCHGEITGCVVPIAPIGSIDIKNDYQTGYNNGFVAGKKKQLKNESSKNSGAYSNSQPTEYKTGGIYQNMVNNISSNNRNSEYIQQAWEDYYWKKEQKKQVKEHYKKELIESFNREFSITNNLITSLKQSDTILDSKVILYYKESNLNLFNKYNKFNNFKSYFKKVNQLRNEILSHSNPH